MDVLKVSSKSNPNSCAGALAGVIRHAGLAELQVVGAGALNQAIKAVAIARGFLATSGLDLVCVPMFTDIEIAGQSRTAIRLIVEDRHHRQVPAAGGRHAAAAVPGKTPVDTPVDTDAEPPVIVLEPADDEPAPGAAPGPDGVEPVLAQARH